MDRNGWTPFKVDSLWVHLSTGLSGMTLRLSREGEEYAGLGYTSRDVAGPAPKGPARLRPVSCAELTN